MTRLGIPYEIKIVPWARAWKMIQNGDADVSLTLSYNKDREPYVYYTAEQKQSAVDKKIPENYLWISEYVFFVKSIHQDSFKSKSYKQIKEEGYKVGVITGNSYFPEFWEVKLDVYDYPTAKDVLIALEKGEIDIYILDKIIGLATIKKLGFNGKIVALPDVLSQKPYFAPFVKNSDYPNNLEIMNRFYDELKNMRESGEYQKIYERYVG